MRPLHKSDFRSFVGEGGFGYGFGCWIGPECARIDPECVENGHCVAPPATYATLSPIMQRSLDVMYERDVRARRRAMSKPMLGAIPQRLGKRERTRERGNISPSATQDRRNPGDEPRARAADDRRQRRAEPFPDPSMSAR